MKIVNGVDISAAPSFPTDGLCPECRMPWTGVEMSAPILRESTMNEYETVRPGLVEGPYFTPCRHDARCCFPKVDP